MSKKLVAMLMGIILLAPFASRAAGPSVTASGIWIHEAPPGVEAMTGYLVLSNHTGQVISLKDVTSPDFGSVAVQQSMQHGDTDNRQPVTHLVIPARHHVTLAPGGDRLMLKKPVKQLYDGDLVTLTLNFSDGSSLTIMAPVRHEPPAH